MSKSFVALCAAAIGSLALLGGASEASAGYGKRGCAGCGPIKPTYTYKTVNKVTKKVRYRDVSRVRYVQRVKRIVHVTRVQPITRVHTVTRVHHRTVAVVRPVHVSSVQYLRPKTYHTSSVKNYYSCGCR